MELVIHVAGMVLWIGGLMAAGLLRSATPGQPSAQRRVMLMIALPGLVLTLLGGVGLLMRFGVSGGWFHAKMLLVVALVVLHVLIAKSRLRGAWLTAVVGLLALCALVLALVKPF